VKKVSFFAALSLSLLLITAVHNITIHMSTALSTTMISVNPLTSSALVGQNFTIDINISDVFDLYGWEFRLRWNSTLLDVVNVTEGSFLKQGGNTFFTFKTNNTAGYILVDCTLLGSILGVSGNGMLATVEFYVESAGESILDLYNTILVNSQEQTIYHTQIDGIITVVTVPFFIEGPYYTWYGAEYWIIEIEKHLIRLVSNY